MFKGIVKEEKTKILSMLKGAFLGNKKSQRLDFDESFLENL